MQTVQDKRQYNTIQYNSFGRAALTSIQFWSSDKDAMDVNVTCMSLANGGKWTHTGIRRNHYQNSIN